MTELASIMTARCWLTLPAIFKANTDSVTHVWICTYCVPLCMSCCHRRRVDLYSITPPQKQLRLDESKLLPAFTPEALLPEGMTSLVQQVLTWPGMSALLGWVSGGHFLGGLGPDDLGRALLDVQVGGRGGGGAVGINIRGGRLAVHGDFAQCIS